MNEIQKFIKDNKLSFKQGSRNTTCTVLTGYAQHLNITKTKLLAGIGEPVFTDSFIKEEVDRLWPYCAEHNYKKFWTTKEASKRYKF